MKHAFLKTRQVTLTIPELSEVCHALSVRLAQFESYLKSEQTLDGTPFYSDKLLDYYRDEIASAKALLAKLESTYSNFDIQH